MKHIISTLLLAAGTVIAQANEAWLKPRKFVYQPGESALISFETGDNFIGTPWDLRIDAIQKLELHQQDRSENLKPSVKTTGKDNLEIPLPHEGTSLIALETTPTQSIQPADQFNQYIKAEGLDDAYYAREQAKALASPAVERSTRYIKLALQVGEKKDDISMKALGFPLEIIPQANPYTIKKGQPLKFTIHWKGKPWFGTRVKVWNREDSRTTIQNVYTGKDGSIEMIVSNTGPWMISTVMMEPAREPGVQWQSYQSTFIFGVQ